MNGLVLVSKAADFAARKHAGQRRKGAAKEPYINHLAEVAELLAETTGGDQPALVAAGWLHDTVEDTGVTREDIEAQFGAEVAALVIEVTDDKRLPKPDRKRLQVENAAKKSEGAKQIKLADKISNIRSLLLSPPDHWERERLIDYIDWAERVIAGCRGVNAALERTFDDTLAQARGSL